MFRNNSHPLQAAAEQVQFRGQNARRQRFPILPTIQSPFLFISNSDIETKGTAIVDLRRETRKFDALSTEMDSTGYYITFLSRGVPDSAKTTLCSQTLRGVPIRSSNIPIQQLRRRVPPVFGDQNECWGKISYVLSLLTLQYLFHGANHA